MNDLQFQRAILSIEGLAMGDAYGNHHGKNTAKHHAPVWEYSDDTIMALSIIHNLLLYGEIKQDVLADSFAKNWNGQRGYGRGVTRLLKQIYGGADWRKASKAMFAGQGSFGNGAAMRVAPVGAYFADDLSKVVRQAELSAEVTHSHIEGIAGAIAVAIGTALVVRNADNPFNWKIWLNEIAEYLPDSESRDKIQHASNLDVSTQKAAKILGNGRPSISQMTVPFSLWCAGNYMDSYEKAIRQVASVQGDVDTNCAIVGSIVIFATGLEGIPLAWIEHREQLQKWAFTEKNSE